MNDTFVRAPLFYKHKALNDLITLLFILILAIPIVAIFNPVFLNLISLTFGNSDPTTLRKFLVKSLAELPVMSVAIWFFLNEPRYFIRRYRLKPLAEVNHGWADQIQALISTITSRPVTLLYQPSQRINAFAFGTWRHHFLSFSEGSLTKLGSPTLKALVLHETSHIVHGDLWKTKLARNVMFLTLVLELWMIVSSIVYDVPLHGSSMVFSFLSSSSNLLNLVFMLIGIRFMIHLGEMIADQFSVFHNQRTRPLLDLFVIQSSVNASVTEERPQRDIWYFPNWLRSHPPLRTRLNNIHNPDMLRNQMNQLAIYAGFSITYLVATIGYLTASVSFTLPVLLVLGSLFILSFDNLANLLEQSWGERLKRDLQLILVFLSSAGILSAFVNLVWGSFISTQDLAQSSVYYLGYARVYSFTSWSDYIHTIWTLADLQLWFYLVLVPVYLFFIVFKNWTSRKMGGDLFFWMGKKAFLFWLLLVPAAGTISVFWFFMVLVYNPPKILIASILLSLAILGGVALYAIAYNLRQRSQKPILETPPLSSPEG